MAVTPNVTTITMTVPIFTRINGNEIELGTCEIEVPVRITVEPTRAEPVRHFSDGCDGDHSPATNPTCRHAPAADLPVLRPRPVKDVPQA